MKFFEPETDVEKGKQIFKKICSYCHSMDPNVQKLGPNLNDIFIREHCSVKHASELTEEKLDEILNRHRLHLPGSKIILAGLEKKKENKSYVIEYLKTWIPKK